MKKRLILVAVVLVVWLLLAFAGYHISRIGESWLGTRTMLIGATIAATLAIAMLLGQYFAGTADYFLSIDNPRPLDDHDAEMTSTAWGFASEIGRSARADQAGEGFAYVRLYASRMQVVGSLFTFGFKRAVSVVWRGNAGQHPLGEA